MTVSSEVIDLLRPPDKLQCREVHRRGHHLRTYEPSARLSILLTSPPHPY